MARHVTCPKCHREFTAAQYNIHKFTHNRDELLQRGPVDPPTSRLLAIEVPDDSDEVMEDVFDVSAESGHGCFSLNDEPLLTITKMPETPLHLMIPSLMIMQ